MRAMILALPVMGQQLSPNCDPVLSPCTHGEDYKQLCKHTFQAWSSIFTVRKSVKNNDVHVDRKGLIEAEEEQS